MFYTARRFKGEVAHAMDLADVLVPQDQVRQAVLDLGTGDSDLITACRYRSPRGYRPPLAVSQIIHQSKF